MQTGHDLVLLDDRGGHIRYQPNAGEARVNEELMHRLPHLELYALLLSKAAAITAVHLALPGRREGSTFGWRQGVGAGLRFQLP